MPIYYGLGDALVTGEELIERRISGDIEKFVRSLADTPDEDAKLELSTGSVTRINLIKEVTSPYDVTTGFEPVGIGKPLTIEIRHIYTGQYPKSRSFGRGGTGWQPRHARDQCDEEHCHI